MRLPILSSVVVLACVISTVGCSPSSQQEEVPASSESALVATTRLDRVTPAEVASTVAKDTADDVARCVAGHPSIVSVDKSNLETFYRTGGDHFWDVREILELMLAEPGVSSVPVATLADAIEPFAEQTLSKHVDAEGFYVPPPGGAVVFYYAEKRTREEKAIALSSKPGGRDLGEIRKLWAAVEASAGALDSAWLNPIKVAGEPSLTDVKKVMRVPFAAEFTAWGNDAVDAFHDASEGPNGTPRFEPLKTFLKSSAIQKRWLFQGYGDEWSTNMLIVLDEHNQLWGMQMGYSE